MRAAINTIVTQLIFVTNTPRIRLLDSHVIENNTRLTPHIIWLRIAFEIINKMMYLKSVLHKSDVITEISLHVNNVQHK